MPLAFQSVKGSAWILSVGNELLIGRVVNTNAAWLAQRLTLLGYAVRRIVVVPDVEEEIAGAFRDALGSADVVVSTGGLGPTPDDVTNFALAKALGRPAEVNAEALRMVEEKYARRGYPMTPEREKMAVMPRGARPLPNPVGTAPGILVEEGSKIVVCLPGVPSEMEAIFLEHVEPLLRSRGPPHFYAERVVRVKGVPESDVAPVVKKALKLSELVYVKSHPRGFEVDAPVLEIHVYGGSEKPGEAESEVERVAAFVAEEIRRSFPEKAQVELR
ncbi:competence/damage-inducible protein cinA [Thermofilum pendens Hrk 5]|uniref:Competence/damage-inducible protein cinA n=1 Tax=Thermofilum pendens (strain DSM 2475 / Hrk 5) TaxID=368408 RepID=A1RZZ3_THEPD|nr:competence/damage-inducible protein cinA [Thermofilum pendens Hrk 5]